MIIPTTGIVFLIGAAVYFYLSDRFYRFYKKETNNTAKWFSFAMFFQGLYFLLEGFTSLFLIDSTEIWSIVDPLRIGSLALAYLMMICAVVRVVFPKFLPLFIFAYLILGAYAISVFVNHPPVMFYTGGTLNWEIEPQISAVLIFLLLLNIPFVVFFLKEAKKAKDRKSKIRALGLGLMFFLWIVSGLIDALLITYFELSPIYSDLNYLITFLVIGITLIKTWGPPSEEWVKKVE